MLDVWGYRYFHIGLALGYAEIDLQRYRAQKTAGIASPRPSTIEPNNPMITALEGRCDDVLRMAQDQDLGAIPANVQILKAKIITARKNRGLLNTDEILGEVERIKHECIWVLQSRRFYSISPEFLKFYGDPQLFGSEVGKKFKASRDDIERAGNCLALGENTACVLHLGRAMEGALRRLAKQLHVPMSPKDTWGVILNNMTPAIAALPEKNERQKRKKSEWAECRTNLYHVKLAWRDDLMHGKRTYDAREARQIMERVEAFMQQLATL